jgi:hypothetical protein
VRLKIRKRMGNPRNVAPARARAACYVFLDMRGTREVRAGPRRARLIAQRQNSTPDPVNHVNKKFFLLVMKR